MLKTGCSKHFALFISKCNFIVLFKIHPRLLVITYVSLSLHLEKPSKAVSSHLYLFGSQGLMKRNTQVATLAILKKVYDIVVEVYPTSFHKGSWTSIFHMTISGNANVYGSRIPGIWFAPLSRSTTRNRILVCNAISGNRNYCRYSAYLPIRRWAKVRVSQQLEGSKYVYRIYINDKQIFSKINTQPREFRNVKVYAGDPWHAAQQGYIRNVQIKGKCIYADGGSNVR